MATTVTQLKPHTGALYLRVHTHTNTRTCTLSHTLTHIQVVWVVLQIISKLALNNTGSRAKLVIALFDCRVIHEITVFIGF
jgi:hypothetical protein